MESTAQDSLLHAGLYIGYMAYHATGEGVRLCISVAASEEVAGRLLKEKLPEYFHPLIHTSPLSADSDSTVERMIEWIPERTKNALVQTPRGAGEYYSELHYNLA
jgi:hypothetical protein